MQDTVTKHGYAGRRSIENNSIMFVPDLKVEGMGPTIKIVEGDCAGASDSTNNLTTLHQVGSVALL